MDVIVTHESADFDGLASLLAARYLYPEAVAVCPSLLDRSVREYVGLHREELGLVDGATIDLDDVSRLVVVDASSLERLGRLSALAKRDGVEIVIFDHHEHAPELRPDSARVASSDGAMITTLLRILSERAIEIRPAEATLFALGIHQDTGSLTYETSTARDADALAYCYRRGADLAAIERYSRLPLDSGAKELLQKLLEATESIDAQGVTVHISAIDCDVFPVGAAQVVDKLSDLTEARALVVLLAHGDKTSCIVRSRGSRLDAAVLARELGGGGHSNAAAATVRAGLSDVRARIDELLPRALSATETAGELMSAPARFVSASTSVRDAMVSSRRNHVSGLLIGSSGDLQGVVSREDLDGALAHDLGHAPVVAVMSPAPPTVSVDAPAPALARLLARPGCDRVAVQRGDEIVGVVTRRDLLHVAARPSNDGNEAASIRVVDAVGRIGGLAQIVDAIDGLAGSHGRSFVVGGAVRDVLLDTDVVDIDISVESPGIDFAHELAVALGGRATPHGDFGTATVTFAGQAVDVATTRSEFYAEPGALPTVESAAIESDLFRRDFTINAMAVALDPAQRGQLVDPYGGERDLASGTLRVLHNLSFVDDPTRLIRAARYEARYGFELDARSESLARACVELGLVRAVSTARIGNELELLLREERGVVGLERLDALGVLAELHPNLDASAEALAAMQRVEELNAELGADATALRLRFAVLTRRLDSSDRYRWLESLQIPRRDVETIANAAALPSSLAARSSELISVRELHALLSSEPIETVLLALDGVEAGSPADRAIRAFITQHRHVRLVIDGNDLAALGLAESPAVGHVLDEVLALKLEGEVTTRDDELAAARRLIRDRELV